MYSMVKIHPNVTIVQFGWWHCRWLFSLLLYMDQNVLMNFNSIKMSAICQIIHATNIDFVTTVCKALCMLVVKDSKNCLWQSLCPGRNHSLV